MHASDRTSPRRALRRRSAGAILAAAALTVAACGGSSDGEAALDATSTTTDTMAPSPTTSEAAATTEAEGADADAAETGDAPAGPRSPWFDERGASELADAFVAGILHPCAGAQPVVPGGDVPEEFAGPLDAMATAIAAAAAACDDEAAFAEAYLTLLTAGADLAQLGGLPATAVVDPATTSGDELVAAALATAEGVAWFFDRSQVATTHSNAVWFDYATRGHLVRLTGAATPPEVTTLVLGTGQAQYGLDPAGLGDDTWNAASPSGTPGVSAQIFDRVAADHPELQRVILAVSAFDVVVGSEAGCSDQRASRLAQTLTMGTDILADAPLAERPSIDDAASVAAADGERGGPLGATALAQQYDASYAGNGTFAAYPTLGADNLARRLEARGRVMTAWVECDERVATARSLVGRIVDGGIDVTVVVLPIHPDVVALAPDGGSAVADLSADLAAQFDELGATVIDLGDALTPDQFLDGALANESGRATLTAAVAEGL